MIFVDGVGGWSGVNKGGLGLEEDDTQMWTDGCARGPDSLHTGQENHGLEKYWQRTLIIIIWRKPRIKRMHLWAPSHTHTNNSDNVHLRPLDISIWGAKQTAAANANALFARVVVQGPPGW